jgi:hypothetical protein
LSVVIPCLDSPVVDRAVAAVRQQLGAGGEIVVVGRDGAHRLRPGQAVFLATDGPRLPGEARNLGVAACHGELVLFLDADCVPAAGWLAAHLARHHAGEAVVGGAVLWDKRPYWTLADNLSMFHESSAWSTAGHRRYLPTLNLSVARSAFQAVGPMDPGLPSGEDLDWTIRANALGFRPYFEPAARVWHRPSRSSPGHAWAHWRDSGRWMVGVRRRHPEVFGAPNWLYGRAAVLALSPLIAAVAALRLYVPGQPGARHPLTLPAVYLTKLAWCVGASRPAVLDAGQRGGQQVPS